MAASDKKIRIFVSSPGDVQEERKVLGEVIKRVNSTQGRERGVHLEIWKSEDAVPRIGPQAQDVIDRQMPSYDIYLGIMAHRFGSATGKYESGTEQEFMDAFEQWGQVGKPWILFYFNEAAVNPATLDLEQYAKVLKFRERVQQQGLYAKYDAVRGTDTAFFDQVELHLRNVIPLILEPPAVETKTKRTNKQRPAKPTIPPSYLDWLRRQCAYIDLLGLRLKEGRAIRLNNVYVPLTANSQLLLSQLNKQSLYVSGDPGSGKSTFCRWVAWLACEKSMPSSEPMAPGKYREIFPASFADRFPLLVHLRDFWPFLPHDDRAEFSLTGFEESLSDWIDEKKRPGLSWPNVKQHLEQGTALLVFDGLDEVPLSRNDTNGTWHPRSLLISGLIEAVVEWDRRQNLKDRNKDKKAKEQEKVPPPNRLLITSRPYGLRDADRRKLGLSRARIEDLSKPLQELLVRRWFAILAEDTATSRELADDMLAHLSGRKGIEDLQASPMLLTAICIIYFEGKRLPHDRCDLYDRIVDTVLYNRFQDPERELVRNELCVVAHTMHTGFHLGEQRTTHQAQITYDEIDRTLEANRQKQRWTHADFKDVVSARENLLSETGLLLPRDKDTAAFYHLSIQ